MTSYGAIQQVRRVVRARRFETVSPYQRAGVHAPLKRIEYTLSCGHKRVEKPRGDRHIPLKMTCKEC